MVPALCIPIFGIVYAKHAVKVAKDWELNCPDTLVSAESGFLDAVITDACSTKPITFIISLDEN